MPGINGHILGHEVVEVGGGGPFFIHIRLEPGLVGRFEKSRARGMAHGLKIQGLNDLFSRQELFFFDRRASH